MTFVVNDAIHLNIGSKAQMADAARRAAFFGISQENYCTQMSHFKAKMHQDRFRLWLCPRPRWGTYSALSDRSDPLAGIKGTSF